MRAERHRKVSSSREAIWLVASIVSLCAVATFVIGRATSQLSLLYLGIGLLVFSIVILAVKKVSLPSWRKIPRVGVAVERARQMLSQIPRRVVRGCSSLVRRLHFLESLLPVSHPFFEGARVARRVEGVIERTGDLPSVDSAWSAGRKYTTAQAYITECERLLLQLERFQEEAQEEWSPNEESRQSFREMSQILLGSPLWLRHPATDQVASEHVDVRKMRDAAVKIKKVLRQRVYDPLNSVRTPEVVMEKAGKGAAEARELIQSLREAAEALVDATSRDAIVRSAGTSEKMRDKLPRRA